MTMVMVVDQTNPNGEVVLEQTTPAQQSECPSVQQQTQPSQPQPEQQQQSSQPRQQRPPRKPREPLVPPTQHEDWIDITPDGGVKKHILVPATSEFDLKRTPNHGSRVRVSYSIKLVEGHVICDNLKFNQESVFSIGLADRPLPNIGLEKAILSMHAGETADVRIAFPYGYAEKTPILIKSIHRRDPFMTNYDTVLYATIRLASYERDKQSPKSIEERLDFIDEDRELGNQQVKKFYKATDDKKKAILKEALRCYNRALNHLSGANMDNETDENIALLNQHAIAIHSNMALVYLKDENETKCIESVEKVLEIDPNHVKAIFRRGQANMKLCRWDDAERDYRRCLELAPDNPEVQKAGDELAEYRAKAEKKSEKFFKNMFQNASGSLYEDAEPLKINEYEEFDKMRNQGNQVWLASDGNTYIL